MKLFHVTCEELENTCGIENDDYLSHCNTSVCMHVCKINIWEINDLHATRK